MVLPEILRSNRNPRKNLIRIKTGALKIYVKFRKV